MNPAQKAWATRRAREAARADIRTLNAGIEKPSAVLKTSKPVVDINLDHHAIGCGLRRFVVLDCGPRLVKLFYYPTLTTVTIDRLTFDRKAKYARDAKRETIARIIRANLALADKINSHACKPIVSDGGADAAKALQVLQ
ncbi:hypothetical protein [Bradyrhizobium sp. SZCCHNR3015]|nr:hypothetical protein [Bradyrhizobium sp. SZCCHNR3015]